MGLRYSILRYIHCKILFLQFVNKAKIIGVCFTRNSSVFLLQNFMFNSTRYLQFLWDYLGRASNCFYKLFLFF